MPNRIEKQMKVPKIFVSFLEGAGKNYKNQVAKQKMNAGPQSRCSRSRPRLDHDLGEACAYGSQPNERSRNDDETLPKSSSRRAFLGKLELLESHPVTKVLPHDSSE